jgi:acetyl esterase/lipase
MPPFDASKPLSQQRAALERMLKRLPVPRSVDLQSAAVAGLAGLWVRPAGAKDGRVLLYLHGGGYAMGSPTTHRSLAAHIAVACAMPVLLVDYRLAPEQPFPAALQDVTAAYRWLLERGHSPRQVAIGGDSAGGGLALATATALRDAADPLPAAIVCLSPWCDLALSGDSVTTRAGADPLLSRETCLAWAAWYAGPHDPASPFISPLNADLRGLPPLLIQVGDREILLSDSIRLAERATRAGVQATLEVWDGLWHVWHFFAGLVPEAQKATDRIGAFVQAQMAG